VAALAYWDETRESAAALDDFADSQALLSQSVAGDFAARLEAIHRDAVRLAQGSTPLELADAYVAHAVHTAQEAPFSPPADGRAQVLSLPLQDGRRVDFLVSTAVLFSGASHLERPNALAVWFLPPDGGGLLSTDGRRIRFEPLRQALETGAVSLRLPRPDPAQLSLPPRTAFAGLARVAAGGFGRWGVAVVASAERERDRESRALTRLLLAAGLAAGLVLTFGGLALRLQRQELSLARELAVAAVERDRDERLARLDRAATMLTLASGVAHELATPLGVIVGRTEQLSARLGSDERTAKSFAVVLEQAERINQVLRGMLELARGGEPAFQETSAAELVRSASALVTHRFAKASVRLTVDVPPDLPALRCERRLMEQALVNLLLNACDAAPRESEVAVSARLEDGTLCFTVLDQGLGIPVEQAARVTEPFFTTKAPGRGTGLGLAVTSEIVKSHHGTLSIGPAEPRGTRARIRVPVQQGAPHARA
jgi:two-component system NtrC family sensor kinase